MKLFSSLLLMMGVALVSSAHAQTNEMIEAMAEAPDFSVIATQVKWQKEHHTAHVMTFHAEAKDLKKAAEDYFENKYAIAFSNVKGFESAEGVVLSDIMTASVTFAFRVLSSGHSAQLEVIVLEDARSISHSSHPTALRALYNVMGAFGRDFCQQSYSAVLKDQEKGIEKERKALGRITKDGEKIQESLEKNSDDIVKAQADIEEKQRQIDELEASIEELKKKVHGLEREKETNAAARAEQEEVVVLKERLLTRLKAAAGTIHH